MKDGFSLARVCALALLVCAGGCDGQTMSQEVVSGNPDASLPTSSCSTLASCCDTLASDVAATCRQLAVQAGTEVCDFELLALYGAGDCRGVIDGGVVAEAGAKVDAAGRADARVSGEGGARSDASASQGDRSTPVACVLLGVCCTSGSVPSDEQTTCASIQGAGVESDCVGELGSLTAAGSCSGASYYGSGGACPELQQCCASQAFPAAFLNSCLDALAQGDDPTCKADLAGFVPAGYCGGAVTGADGGHAPDPDCTALDQQCCQWESFPANTLSTCEHLVKANVGGECLSADQGWEAVGYCAD
jgi:hypothetical protein